MSTVDPEAIYAALISDPGRLRGLRRLQYRCTNRCLLLEAIEVGDTVLLHQKRFKNSNTVNLRRSSASGREANTYDGHNHWKPRTYWIEQSALAHPDAYPMMRMDVQCDHVGVLANGDGVTLPTPDFHSHWQAGLAEVRIRPDGSLYVVG